MIYVCYWNSNISSCNPMDPLAHLHFGNLCCRWWKYKGEPGGWWHKLGQISSLPGHSKIFLLFPVFFERPASCDTTECSGKFSVLLDFSELMHYSAGFASMLLLRWAEICPHSWEKGWISSTCSIPLLRLCAHMFKSQPCTWWCIFDLICTFDLAHARCSVTHD